MSGSSGTNALTDIMLEEELSSSCLGRFSVSLGNLHLYSLCS